MTFENERADLEQGHQLQDLGPTSDVSSPDTPFLQE
jgi:hypothetical protein